MFKSKFSKITMLIVAMSVLGYIGVWYIQRSFNYAWGYESQVESTICKMVKREYLKNPNNC